MVAESEGFEPPIPLRVLLISNQVPSAARPALHLIRGPATPAPRTPAVRRRGPTRPVVGPLRLLAASQPDPRDPSSDRLFSDALCAFGRGPRQAVLAERVGFEPTIRCRIHAFQACAFGRSATSPESWVTSSVSGRTRSTAPRILPR